LPQSVFSKKDERTIARLASKTDRAVEPDLKRFRPYICNRLARLVEALLGQAAKEEKRDVQAVSLDKSASQIVSAL
jgi:hypothetical protein